MANKNFNIISHMYGINVDKNSFICLENFILCDISYGLLNLIDTEDIKTADN